MKTRKWLVLVATILLLCLPATTWALEDSKSLAPQNLNTTLSHALESVHAWFIKVAVVVGTFLDDDLDITEDGLDSALEPETSKPEPTQEIMGGAEPLG